MKALERAADVANKHQFKRGDKDELETYIVRETVVAFCHAANELGKVIEEVNYLQEILATGIDPKLRTRAEKRLVTQEPDDLYRSDVPLSEKSNRIDNLFTQYADRRLDGYRTKDGKPIRRHAQIIEHLFKFGLQQTKSAEGIQKALSPSRRRASR